MQVIAGNFDDATHDYNDNYSSNYEFDANLNDNSEIDATHDSSSGANCIDNFEFDQARDSSSADNINTCNNNLSINNKMNNTSTCITKPNSTKRNNMTNNKSVVYYD